MRLEFRNFYKPSDQKSLNLEIYTVIRDFKFGHITVFVFMLNL